MNYNTSIPQPFCAKNLFYTSTNVCIIVLHELKSCCVYTFQIPSNGSVLVCTFCSSALCCSFCCRKVIKALNIPINAAYRKEYFFFNTKAVEWKQ